MPWKVEDVESHKSGLNDRAKKQWIRIANSVLARELKKGKDEKEAAASAIKQANGVVQVNKSDDNYSVYKTKQTLAYEPKIVVHQEKAHLVVPVVMMVEGVHNGSQGPLFHSINELGKFPESWNGIPVVIYHPEEEGSAVSANSPAIIDKMTVGRVYGTYVEDSKLKAEIWLDEDKLNAVSPQTLEEINASKEIEVSLGMFTENKLQEGDYNGKPYVGIAENHRPDHLAILPDQIGACSCADGCGIGANVKYKGQELEELRLENIKVLSKKDMKKDMKKESMPDEEDDQDEDDLTVDKKCKKKQVNSVNSGGVEAIEPVVMSINNKNGGQKMANAKDCPKCLEKINALIANTASKFEEADREWLLTQEESVLDKLAPTVKEVEKIVEKTVEVNNLSDEDKAALAFGKKQMKERKDKMIQGIQANTEKGTWDEVTLNSMSEDMLERVYKSVRKEEAATVYLGSGVQNNAGTEEALYPAGVEIKK